MIKPIARALFVSMVTIITIGIVGCDPITSTSENAMSDPTHTTSAANDDPNYGQEPLGTPLVGETRTIAGEVTDHIPGAMVDANNSLVVRTTTGESLTVKVMEAGRVPSHLRDQVCNKNQRANEVFNTLNIGDHVEVFGKIVSEDTLEVCSSERFWIEKRG